MITLLLLMLFNFFCCITIIETASSFCLLNPIIRRQQRQPTQQKQSSIIIHNKKQLTILSVGKNKNHNNNNKRSRLLLPFLPSKKKKINNNYRSSCSFLSAFSNNNDRQEDITATNATGMMITTTATTDVHNTTHEQSLVVVQLMNTTTTNNDNCNNYYYYKNITELRQKNVDDLFVDATTTSATALSSETSETTTTLATLPLSQAILLLNVVAIIWGSQHAIIKMVIDDTNDPSSFTLLRFGLAALLASPYTPGLSNNKENNNKNTEISTTSLTTINDNDDNDYNNTNNDWMNVWRWGIEMGIWMFLGFSFQAIGLEYTTAQRSGFLLYLNVKFVPFFARILYGRKISIATWISAVTAFIGTALLAGIFATTAVGSSSGSAFNIGDAWSIAAAMTSAMFILRLERASAVVPDSASLNAACLWVVAILASVWTICSPQPDNSNGIIDIVTTLDITKLSEQLVLTATNHPFEIIYLGGITTALANWIQTKAQRGVSAERASVIYAMDPVYGAIFSYWLLGETLNGIQGWIGAALITIAAATNAFIDLAPSSSPKINVDDKTR